VGKKGRKAAKSRSVVEPATDAMAGPAMASAVDAGQLATRLNSTAVHLLRRLHREDAALGVSSSRLSALTVLVFGGPRTLGSLARAEGVTPPSMTRLVSAMEADGLVERTRSESDGRLVIIRATDAAVRLLHQGRDQRVAVLAGLVRALPDEDQATLDRAASILESILRPAGGS
jgi:DNA-binding MarR family transcriptional regulator